MNMKKLLSVLVLSTTMTAWSDVPVLATDITPNQKIINLGYSDVSMTQDFESGYAEVVTDTNIDVKTLELIVSGESTHKAIPILSLAVSKLSSDDGSDDVSSYDVYAGFALEGDMKKNLLLVSYEGSSENTLQSSYGLMAVFRSAPNEYTKSDYELVTSLELQDSTDEVSGGHSAGISLNSKYPFSNSVHLVSNAGLSLEADTDYATGEYRKAGPGINAGLGLSIQPQPNMEIEVGLASFVQHFKYYQSNDRYEFKETRTGVGLSFDLNIAL
jgi:hypothetical protein